jgi:hypothetical protein
MYFRVYAPSGEPFDVPRELADKLILQEGWTQSPASTAWLDAITGVGASAPVDTSPVDVSADASLPIEQPKIVKAK